MRLRLSLEKKIEKKNFLRFKSNDSIHFIPIYSLIVTLNNKGRNSKKKVSRYLSCLKQQLSTFLQIVQKADKAHSKRGITLIRKVCTISLKKVCNKLN